MAWFGTKFEQNCWKIASGLSAYSSQQQEKAVRQQKTSRLQFCSNLVPNHFTGLSVAPRSLADNVHSNFKTRNPKSAITLNSSCHHYHEQSWDEKVARQPKFCIPSTINNWRKQLKKAILDFHPKNLKSEGNNPWFKP